jgi:hypothetical protein
VRAAGGGEAEAVGDDEDGVARARRRGGRGEVVDGDEVKAAVVGEP